MTFISQVSGTAGWNQMFGGQEMLNLRVVSRFFNLPSTPITCHATQMTPLCSQYKKIQNVICTHH